MEGLCTRYKEITDLPEIQLRVKEVIKDKESPRPAKKLKKDQKPAEDGPKTLEDGSWLSDMNLVCFAEFTTVRRSFTLEEDGVQVDLDQADFGYSVGEIEVLLSDREDVQSALDKIEKSAQKLGKFKVTKLPNHHIWYYFFPRELHVVRRHESRVCMVTFTGLTGNQRVPGKMTVFLQRNHPKHYEQLMSKHIL